MNEVEMKVCPNFVNNGKSSLMETLVAKIKSFIRKHFICKSRDVFYELSPVDYVFKDDDVRVNEAVKAMDFALNKKQSRILNIAIMGPFGSGKSSFWLSYKKKKKEENDLPFTKEELLEVSFAKFTERSENCSNDDSSNDSNAIRVNNYDVSCMDDKEKEEFDVERGVLQQILFSVESDKIPKANVLKKYDNPIWLNMGLALCFIVIYLLYSVEFIGLIEGYVDAVKDDLIPFWSEWTKRIVLFSALTLLSTFIYIVVAICLYRFLNRIPSFCLSRISFKGLDVSFDEGKGSLINQNIRELIYFFEKTKKRIVVFEDIDRNKTNVIFSKLRELNRVLNNCPKFKKEGAKIKFIYMIADDVLQKYERTKFFDFIVPIVPVLNGNNAADYIMKYFVNDNMFDDDKPQLSFDYLKTIQKYLDDLRLVKNCFNELRIYKKKNIEYLGKEGDEKIFSLILYKNLYPRDYQNLLRQKGLLYYCLNDATRKIQEKKEDGAGEKGDENA